MNTIKEKIAFALGLPNIKDRSGKSSKVVTPSNRKHKFTVEATLTDGTTVQADSLEQGSMLYILDEDGNTTPAPAGTYETDDLIIDVDADGTIEDVQEQGDNSDTAENTGDEAEDDMEDEMKADPTATSDAGTASTITLQDLATKLDALCAAIDTLAKGKETMRKVEKKPAAAQKVTKHAFSAPTPDNNPLHYEV